ncbi:MAG TPA: hypothetical protein VFG76_02540, partial [Candidatus Polarisedimenticolia bacterium]|nr:hypothetical protein [Candidatus Polarisedimenticolia bacterium]
NPASRQAYDRSETLPLKRRRATSRLNDPRLLAACVTLFIGILAFVWLPLYGSRFKTFETGDRLLDRSGFSFGVIVQSEEQHTFEGGVVAPAYLVKTAATGELRWFPMGDIQATCSKER